MEGEGFFTTVAFVGLSIAGFGGLLVALDPRPWHDTPVASWRVRTVVSFGLRLTMVSLGVVAFFTLSGDQDVTVRLGTAALVLVIAQLAWAAGRPGPAWDNDSQRRTWFTYNAVHLAVALPNLVLASTGYLQLLFVWALGLPFSIFLRSVAGVGREVEDESTD
jgi:hypothetical protein